MSAGGPTIGRFLSQGTTAGATVAFVLPLIYILSHPTNVYNCVFIFLLPFSLVASMILGLLPAILIWACTRWTGRALSSGERVGLGILVTLLFMFAAYLLIPGARDSIIPSKPPYTTHLTIYGTAGIVTGLIIGSRLQPWSALVRGVDGIPPKARVLTAVTGFVMRVLVVWGLMESTLTLMCTLQGAFTSREPLYAGLLLAHFTFASVIIFTRMRFTRLVPLALIANVPVGLLIRDFFRPPDDYGIAIAAIFYLAVWAIFLLSRWRATYAALSSFTDELRYYLID